jgi:3-oxoacyl-[acyl-carrier protein] reductase
MISADLSGRRALVTGGASGIGLATAEALARCGAEVAINHLEDDPRGPEAAARLGARTAPGDVSVAGAAEAMVARAIDALGGLDILINNAGTPVVSEPVPYADLDRLDEPFWDAILSTNLVGPFRCVRAAAPALREAKGCIVATASIAGMGGQASSLAYAASKAGLINLTRNLAQALAPDVRVNAVAPGLTRTPWTESWPAARKERSLENTLLGRFVEAGDIADAMIFLCAQPAVTGQTIVVDCGRVFAPSPNR